MENFVFPWKLMDQSVLFVLSFFQAKNREPLGVICVLLIKNAPFGFRQNARNHINSVKS